MLIKCFFKKSKKKSFIAENVTKLTKSSRSLIFKALKPTKEKKETLIKCFFKKN